MVNLGRWSRTAFVLAIRMRGEVLPAYRTPVGIIAALASAGALGVQLGLAPTL
jgi:hypothetical protein